MIKTTRYCDICGREQHKCYDNYYEMFLPERDYDGNIILSEHKKDVCKSCLKEIYWKLSEITHPNRKCPD